MSRPKLPRDTQGNIIRPLKTVPSEFPPVRIESVGENVFESVKIIEPTSAPTTFDKPEQDLYTITLSLGADIYSVTGSTILEALSQIHPTTFGKSFATIQIEYKGKVTKLPIKIMPIRLKEMFNKPYSLQNWAKRLSTLV